MNPDFETANLVPSDHSEEKVARGLLDQLIDDARLYRTTGDYLELLNFITRLRNFAPFNAMLLHFQKPGLSYAASARDWREKFARAPKEQARPLIILWPFGPVAFVYDVMDTEGAPLPEDVNSFFAKGPVTHDSLNSVLAKLQSKKIHVTEFDGGDRAAGSIRRAPDHDSAAYQMQLNRNHSVATQFVTIAHELGHLFLGHLGLDNDLRIPDRHNLDHSQVELEAEAVAYLVSQRNGVESKSASYLNRFVDRDTTIDSFDLYQVTRAAGHIESLLGLTSCTRF